MQALLDHIRAVQHETFSYRMKTNYRNFWTIWMNMKDKDRQFTVNSKQLSVSPSNPVQPDRFGIPTGTSGSLKVVALLITLLLLTGSNLLAQTPKFDLLKERFETGEVFAADFDHTY